MSLVGRYGRASQRAAERMLDEGVYYAACSDAHRPTDVEHVEDAIGRLIDLVGEEEAEELLSENPRRILSGNVEI
jgi:protein-tyrosine phosphatase